MTVSDAKRYMDEGHFKPGSMLPKIKAIVRFLEKTQKPTAKAIITDPEHIPLALEDKTGTTIVK